MTKQEKIDKVNNLKFLESFKVVKKEKGISVEELLIIRVMGGFIFRFKNSSTFVPESFDFGG